MAAALSRLAKFLYLRPRVLFPVWGEDAGFFVPEDARDARFGTAVRAGFRSRGSAPSAALGRLEDGAPAPRNRHLRRRQCLLCGAPTTIDTGASRTEPPLRVTASAAEITSSPRSITAEKPSLEQPLHELMTFVMGRS